MKWDALLEMKEVKGGHTYKKCAGKIVSMRPERLCNFSLFRFHPVLPTAQVSLHQDGDTLFANTDIMSLSMH